MNFQQRQYTDCDIVELAEYDRLVSNETEVLQAKMTTAIDSAMETIQTKQAELMAEIKSDPRKSSIGKKNIKLVLQISSDESDGKRGRPQRVKFTYIHRIDTPIGIKTYISPSQHGYWDANRKWISSIGERHQKIV